MLQVAGSPANDIAPDVSGCIVVLSPVVATIGADPLTTTKAPLRDPKLQNNERI